VNLKIVAIFVADNLLPRVELLPTFGNKLPAITNGDNGKERGGGERKMTISYLEKFKSLSPVFE